MAKTREQLKEAVRRYDLRVTDFTEFDKEATEFIKVTGAGWDEIAKIGAEARDEPVRREP